MITQVRDLPDFGGAREKLHPLHGEVVSLLLSGGQVKRDPITRMVNVR